MKSTVKQTLKTKIDGLSIFSKITILFEIVLIISLNFITIFATLGFSDMVKEEEIALGATKMDRLSTYMQEKYNRVYSLSNYIHSSDLSTIMRDIDEKQELAYTFNNINYINVFFAGVSSADSDISDVILISTSGIVYSYTKRGYAEARPSYPFMESSAIVSLIDSKDDMRILYSDPSEYSLRPRTPVISFIGKIYDSSLYPKKELVGIYIMNIPVEAVESVIEPVQGSSKGEISLVNSNMEVLYSTAAESEGTRFDSDLLKSRKDLYYISKSLGLSGMQVEYVLSNKLLFKEINRLQRNIALVLVISIIVTILFGYMVYRIFNKRVMLLIRSMNRVQQGELNFMIPVQSTDEIGMLSKSFNEMCEKLNEYIRRVYQAELQRKSAELNALQTQIDPHFLYNTLESIKAKALEENDEVSAEMITLLGNLFRWSSRTKDKFIILEEEMDYVKTYLKLQSYRLNETMEMDIKIPEEHMDYAIPKLILQPIVENTIKHALACLGRPGLVGITSKKKGQNLEITVFDNGCGMSKEQLEEIRKQLKSDTVQDDFSSIGIQNVNHRLILLFGEKCGLSVESIEGKGTAVKVTIPAMSVEEMNSNVQTLTY